LRLSRGRWKQKYLDLKRDQKRLQNRVAALRRSRVRWTEKATTAAAAEVTLQARVEALEAQTARRREPPAPSGEEKKG
jgi:hypothetical protein